MALSQLQDDMSLLLLLTEGDSVSSFYHTVTGSPAFVVYPQGANFNLHENTYSSSECSYNNPTELYNGSKRYTWVGAVGDGCQAVTIVLGDDVTCEEVIDCP